MKPTTQKKLQTEKKRLTYSTKLFLSYILAAVILVIITNIVVKMKGFSNAGWFEADAGAWIAFYGTLIGGFITLLGVNQTIRFTRDEDKRLQKLAKKEKDKEADLLLIRHLWELETSYHKLSRTIQIVIAKLDALKEPSITDLEEVFLYFQDRISEEDYISLSAKIDWETYAKVNSRMRLLRKLFIQAEMDLLNHRSKGERLKIKVELTKVLRKEKIIMDEIDAYFDEKRALVEERHLVKEEKN